ncbi:Mechanosensitive ion channel-domain-containing protein [Infundibulicybe gibba]|nr:Mechanosensitive ion channel-domain-containing protein [Infundibulicybe gibba]
MSKGSLAEEHPLPPKKHDYAPHPTSVSPNEPIQESPSDTDTTATNSSDEFDWDEDEDSKEKHTERIKARRGRAIWMGFMRLARPFRVMLVAILGAGVLITPLLVVQFRFNRTGPITSQVYVWSLWFSIIWAAGCATYLVVDSIPRVVIAIIVLFGGQVERLKTQLELTLAVSGWLKLALDIAWAWISLSVIRTTYRPAGSYWVIINRVMQHDLIASNQALFSTGLILLVEKLFLQFVAINFHQKALAERLAENRLGLKALDRLSNAQPAPSRSPYAGRRGHKSTGGSISNALDATGDNRRSVEGVSVHHGKGDHSSHRHAKNQREDRQRRRKKAMASIIVDQLGGAIGQVALKDSKFNRGGEIGGLHSARRLAKKLFSALSDVSPPRSHLLVEDFYPYFRSTSEAHDAFALFDKDSNGDISKREMREAVQRIYRERKALIASLKFCCCEIGCGFASCGLMFIIFVCLLIFNRQNTLASLVPLATIILGFSFVFGHSAQTLFESLIFIFSTHVFDVGDLVMIDDQPLLVREFGLFSTTFRRVDGQEIIAPNALLASSKLVHNLRRSKSMWESTKLMISYNTPLEVIEQLRTRINAYVAENSREWSSCGLNIDKMEYQNAIHLVVAMEHRPNWQDWGGRWARRTAFMRNLKIILEELDVRYTLPIQPVLLPQAPPSNSNPFRLQPSPHGGPTASQETLGNAGRFQASDHAVRAPGRSFRAGVDSFE